MKLIKSWSKYHSIDKLFTRSADSDTQAQYRAPLLLGNFCGIGTLLHKKSSVGGKR